VGRKKHWEHVYATKADDEVSWTQADPRTSLALIEENAPGGTVIDVGGGTSVLVDRLAAELGEGFALRKELAEKHTTPWGKPQQFRYAVFERSH
jgi:hypothetical protein